MSEALKDMPKYKCHKVVSALKIAEILVDAASGSGILVPEMDGYAQISVSKKYLEKHDPHSGDYYVRYQDGYESCSPSKAFEAGYTGCGAVSRPFGFGEALIRLKNGQTVSRLGWNGPGQSLRIHSPSGLGKMSLPYIYIQTVQGDLVPWLASQTDMLADDWQEV